MIKNMSGKTLADCRMEFALVSGNDSFEIHLDWISADSS